MEQHNRSSVASLLKNEATERTENFLYMFSVIKPDGIREIISEKKLRQTIGWACIDYESVVDPALILTETLKNVFDGITPSGIADALILAATCFIERDPAYSKVAVRLQLKKLFKQVVHSSIGLSDSAEKYRASFISTIITGIELELLDKRLADFDLQAPALCRRLQVCLWHEADVALIVEKMSARAPWQTCQSSAFVFRYAATR